MYEVYFHSVNTTWRFGTFSGKSFQTYEEAVDAMCGWRGKKLQTYSIVYTDTDTAEPQN